MFRCKSGLEWFDNIKEKGMEVHRKAGGVNLLNENVLCDLQEIFYFQFSISPVTCHDQD